DTFNLTGDYNRGVRSIVGRYTFTQFGAECRQLMRAGAPFVVQDAEEDPRTEAARDSYRVTLIRSIICVPILKASRFVAAMAVHQATPREWQPEEVELVQQVASRCWESIERTRVTRSLRESEEQFRTLANTIPNLAWMAEPDGHIDWYNGRWYEYTGRTAEEMTGWGWQSVHDPAVLPEVVERWSASLAEGTSFEMVFPLKGADGKFRPFLTRVEPVKDAQGRIAKWFGTNPDISSQQEARQTAELLNRVGPLLAAELNTHSLAQKVTDIATQLTGAQFGALFHSVLDEHGESYTLYTLSGVPREEFSKFPMPRNTKVFAPTFMGEGVLRSDDITADPRYGQNPPYHGMPEGHLPVRSYLALPVMSRSGEVLGGLFFGHAQPGQFTEQHEQIAAGIAAQSAIALDNARLFTESQKAQDALSRSNTELRRANQDLEQFAFSASHDLQEPLRMVSLYCQMLQRRYADRLDQQAHDSLGYAVQGAKRMEMLIRDLLAYTQVVTVTTEAVAPTASSDALQRAQENLQGVIDEAGAVVESDTLPVLLVKDVHLLQLFQNIIGNSLKYRSDEPPVIRVSAAGLEQGMWTLCVRDNGIGIDPQYAGQIFGIFKRLHNNTKYPGTGIGLAICQKIVERYGGRIWVQSEGPSRGSAFYFSLPGAELKKR
ncbi:MAG TPA: GAF domain-containing protein, partial [Bryobacteraceae bacterium]|nr:GAF domain-containing protein [Bryobacteraceae bacterium]